MSESWFVCSLVVSAAQQYSCDTPQTPSQLFVRVDQAFFSTHLEMFVSFTLFFALFLLFFAVEILKGY